jgi:hypothetical protein
VPHHLKAATANKEATGSHHPISSNNGAALLQVVIGNNSRPRVSGVLLQVPRQDINNILRSNGTINNRLMADFSHLKGLLLANNSCLPEVRRLTSSKARLNICLLRVHHQASMVLP